MFKLLISALPNIGKTTLCKDLDPATTLVISRDGKQYPLALPHRNIEDFEDVDDLIGQINSAIGAFSEKTGTLPKTLVLDSVSKIFLDIEARILKKVKSFPYGVINIEISKFMEYVEHTLAPNANVIYISHAIFDADTGKYQLVNAGGSWGKKGGVISEVDQAVFIDLKGKKRTVYHKMSDMLSRTTLEELPDSQPIEEYSLATHVEALEATASKVGAFQL